VSALQQGRIVWATIRDPNGENPKERPAVIVTATEEIHPDQPFVAVAITGTLPRPLPPEYVELPWHRSGHPRTGLKKRCAAVCTWLLALQASDIQGYGGIVPELLLRAILERLPQTPPPQPPAEEP
jgi:mRNA-degrading endonuclease toxin of MazEF toxin-antitoxin module